MNIKNIIVGSLAFGLAFGGIFYKISSKEIEAVYTSRNSDFINGNKGRAEYLHKLRADPATGVIDEDLVLQARNEVFARMKQNNKALIPLNWEQMGPDNVGGRTRGILVDQNNPNTVYAGSVAGGLFVSNDGTQTWSPVAGHQGDKGDNLMVSKLTQTQDGRIFFGTGSFWEGNTGPFPGNGVYEYVPSTGEVKRVLIEATVLPNINKTGTLSEINQIHSQGNRLFIGTKLGFYYADPDPSSGNYPSTLSDWTNPITTQPVGVETARVHDFAIGSDGGFIVCMSGGKVYTSNDGSVGSFVRQTIGAGRFNVAIAPSNPNVYYLLRNSGDLISLDISQDKGKTWEVIVPGGSPCIDPFFQNSCDGFPQGIYDACIAVDPSDWGHILVGGVQLYEWRYNPGSVPIGGSWLRSATLTQSVFNLTYVHADKHIIVWPDENTVYIGHDGGVSKSTDGGLTYQERNLGYNVTTFYDMDVAANGFFMGGAQDNGTQMFTKGTLGELTPLGTTEIQGGDGIDCAFSNFVGGIQYATSQNGDLRRYVTGGAGGNFFNQELNTLIYTGPPLDRTRGNGQPFHTVIENWEKQIDPLSIDSVMLIFDSVGTNFYGEHSNGDTIVAGDTIFSGTRLYYESLSNGKELTYVVPNDIILDYPIDANVRLIDPVQNKFAYATSVGVFLTRDGARLNALEPDWYKIIEESSVECMEFSADGNHLFVGKFDGEIWRISNLSAGNTYNNLDIRNKLTTSLDPDSNRVTTVVRIANFSNAVTGIAADPNNVENLIVTLGNYNSNDHVFRSTNAVSATGTSGTFTSIQGSTLSLPFMPIYDAEIDYSDNDQVIIGTEWGVWTTDNAFSATGTAVEWTDESDAGMAHVPVFAVKQQHLKSTEAVNSGYIYLGTYGRGFYKSEDLHVVSVDENEFEDARDRNGFVSNLSIYPNPLNTQGMISFDLNEVTEATVNIYNLSGSLVKTIELGRKFTGNHKVRFDASNLSIGSYILSLESNSERSIGKFIVTR